MIRRACCRAASIGRVKIFVRSRRAARSANSEGSNGVSYEACQKLHGPLLRSGLNIANLALIGARGAIPPPFSPLIPVGIKPKREGPSTNDAYDGSRNLLDRVSSCRQPVCPVLDRQPIQGDYLIYLTFPIEIRARAGLACLSELLSEGGELRKCCHPTGKSGYQGLPGIRLHKDPAGLIEVVGGSAPGGSDDRKPVAMASNTTAPPHSNRLGSTSTSAC